MRTIFGVPIILVVLVVAVAFNGRISRAEPAAADDCATKPGASAPQGSHWYYRIERSSGRHCWYLGPLGAKAHASETRTRTEPATGPARANRQRQADEARVTAAAPQLAVAEGASANMPFQTNGSAESETAPQTQPEIAATPEPPASRDDASSPPAVVDAPDEGEEEMPLVWPELSAAERAAAAPSGQAKLRWEYVLATIAGALALAAMVVGATFKPSARREAARVRPRDWQDVSESRECAPWLSSSSPPTSPTELPPALRRRAATADADEIARWAAPPVRSTRRGSDVPGHDASGREVSGYNIPDDVEASLQRLLRAWQHAAA